MLGVRVEFITQRVVRHGFSETVTFKKGVEEAIPLSGGRIF